MHTAKALSLVFVALMLLFGTLVFAQPSIVWQKCLGGSRYDVAYSVQQTSDGGFILAGISKSNDGEASEWHEMPVPDPEDFFFFDYWIVRLNSSGDIVWQKCLGGSGCDIAYSIQQTSDGGFIVAGETWSFVCDVSEVIGNHGVDFDDFWVVKLNSSGDIVWQKCLGGSYEDGAYSIQQTSDGGFIVAGWTLSNDGDVSGNHGRFDFWVVKLNPSGDIVWQKCLGGSDDEEAHSIQQTSDGGFIVAGETYSNDGDVSGNHGLLDFWVVRLNFSGGIIWQKCLGGSGWDEAHSIQQTSDGGFIVAGHTLSLDADYDDAFLLKTDAYGQVEWMRQYGEEDWDEGFSAVLPLEDGFLAVGAKACTGRQREPDMYVVRTDASGNPLWEKTLGRSEFEPDGASDVVRAHDGGRLALVRRTALRRRHPRGRGRLLPPGARRGQRRAPVRGLPCRAGGDGPAPWHVRRPARGVRHAVHAGRRHPLRHLDGCPPGPDVHRRRHRLGHLPRGGDPRRARRPAPPGPR